MTTRPPFKGMPKSRAYSCITYITPRPVASSRPSDPPSATGLMYVMQEYARDFGIPLKGGRVVIQGFGNVGSHLARLLDSEAGAKIVAVSAVEGGVYNDQGLDIPGLLAHVAQGKAVTEWK